MGRLSVAWAAAVAASIVATASRQWRLAPKPHGGIDKRNKSAATGDAVRSAAASISVAWRRKCRLSANGWKISPNGGVTGLLEQAFDGPAHHRALIGLAAPPWP